MKRISAIALALFVSLTLTCCKQEEKNDSQNEDVKNTAQEEVSVNENNEDKIEGNGIVLDIKPLEEVDETTLEEAAESLGFVNKNLFHAVANAMGKEPKDMTQEDIDKVHYIAVGPESDGRYSVFIGYVDYIDACSSSEYTDEEILGVLNELVMVSEFSYDKEKDTLSDLGLFTNTEMFEIYDVEIEDISFIKNYKTLALGYFKNNGITDVSSLKDYNPESLVELDLTGNSISDWSPLYHIKEKVTVFYGVSDGMPIVLTLEDKLNQENEKAANGEEENQSESFENNNENTTENTDDEIIFVDENGEQVDFGSLFD